MKRPKIWALALCLLILLLAGIRFLRDSPTKPETPVSQLQGPFGFLDVFARLVTPEWVNGWEENRLLRLQEDIGAIVSGFLQEYRQLDLAKQVGLRPRLTVRTNVPEASIKIMNIKAPYRDGMQLDPGEYRIRVEAPGYDTRKRKVTLYQDTTVFVPLFTLIERGLRLLLDKNPGEFRSAIVKFLGEVRAGKDPRELESSQAVEKALRDLMRKDLEGTGRALTNIARLIRDRGQNAVLIDRPYSQ